MRCNAGMAMQSLTFVGSSDKSEQCGSLELVTQEFLTTRCTLSLVPLRITCCKV